MRWFIFTLLFSLVRSQCPINTELVDGVCESCASGRYTNVLGGTCTDCEAGFYTVDPPSGGYTDINCSRYGDFTNGDPGFCNVVTASDPLMGCGKTNESSTATSREDCGIQAGNRRFHYNETSNECLIVTDTFYQNTSESLIKLNIIPGTSQADCETKANHRLTYGGRKTAYYESSQCYIIVNYTVQNSCEIQDTSAKYSFYGSSYDRICDEHALAGQGGWYWEGRICIMMNVNVVPRLFYVSAAVPTPYYDVGLKCLKCAEGQYQTQTGQSSCLPWTVCLDGQVEERSPDHTKDRICGSCAQGRYNFLDTCYDCPSGQFMDQENHIYEPPKCGSNLYFKYVKGSYTGEISVKITFYDSSGTTTDVTYVYNDLKLGETTCATLTGIPSNANLCAGGKIDVDLIDSWGDGWNGNEIRYYPSDSCDDNTVLNTDFTLYSGRLKEFTIDFDENTFGISTTVPDGAEVCQLCSACAKGKYHDPNDTCNTTKRTTDSLCIDCPVETFADETGLTECKACPEGQHQPATGSEACICSADCPIGKESFTEQLPTTTTVDIDYQGKSYTGTFYDSDTWMHINGNEVLSYQYSRSPRIINNLPASYGVNIKITMKFQKRYTTTDAYLIINGEQAVKFPDNNQPPEALNGYELFCYEGSHTPNSSPSSTCSFYIYETYRFDLYKNVSTESERCICRECATGKFKNISGDSLCASCAIGQYQDLEGQTSCQTCQEGKTSLLGASSCINCPDGQTSTIGICYGCSTGKYEENNTCHNCPIGTYNNQTGQTSCTTCPNGQYQDQTGQATCKPYQNCPQGTYTPIGNPETGVVCQACPKGRYSDQENLIQCKTCGIGQYQDVEGQTSCQPCVNNTYTLGYGTETCTRCPSGTYFNAYGDTTCETFNFHYDYSNAQLEYVTTGLNLDTVSERHCKDVLGAPQGYNYDGNRPIGCTYDGSSYFWNTASHTNIQCSTSRQCVRLKSSSIYFDPMPPIVRRTSGTNELSVSREICLSYRNSEVTSGNQATNCSINVLSDGTTTSKQHYNTLVTSIQCSSSYQCVQYETYHELFSGCVVGSYTLQTREPWYGVSLVVTTASKTVKWSPTGIERFSVDLGSVDTSEVCEPCQPGTFDNGSACQACVTGKYQDEEGQMQCKDCAAGRYQNETGQTSCKVCEPGNFADVTGLSTCKSCAVGTFNNFNVPCEQLSLDYVSYNGQCLTLTISDPGRECLSSRGSAIANIYSIYDCAKATYPSRFYYDGSSCYSVVRHSLSSNQKKLHMSKKLNSYTCSYQQCQTYSYGGYSQRHCKTVTIMGSDNIHVSSVNTSCDRDTTCYDPTRCLQCPQGRFQDQTGQGSCKDCVFGENYQDETGAVNCKDVSDCQPGSYKGLIATVYRDQECLNCSKGRYSTTQNVVSCTTCSYGQYQDEEGKTLCDPHSLCNPGQYIFTFGNTTNDRACTDCQLGRYETSREAYICKICPRGYKGNTLTGQTSCTPCPSGTYDPSERSGMCVNTSVGHYQPYDGAITQLQCPPGEYQDEEGQSRCKDCAAGSYNDVYGASAGGACKLCETGKYQDQEGASLCVVCPLGTYNDVVGAPVCKECPSGRYGSTTGLDICAVCETGRYQHQTKQTDCIDCVSGQYQDQVGQSQCKDCLKGSYMPLKGASECLLCPRGRFESKTGSIECDKCEVGRYQGFSGSLDCVDCPNGRYGPTTGLIECENCPSGSSHQLTKQTNASVCESCLAGSYAGFGLTYVLESSKRYVGFVAPTLEDALARCNISSICLGVSESGSGYTYGGLVQHLSGVSYRKQVSNVLECLPCPKGTYEDRNSSIACKECAVGRYQDVKGSLECKECASGRFESDIGSLGCDLCVAGQYSKQGAYVCLKCELGRYQNASGSSSCLKCPSGRFQDQEGSLECKECPEGTQQPLEGQARCDGCPPGTRSVVDGNDLSCVNCTVGRYQSFFAQAECVDCPRGRYADQEGLQVCKRCEGNTFQDREGQTSCMNCPPAQTSNALKDGCDACPDGTVLSGTECAECDLGKYAKKGFSECLKCAHGRYADVKGLGACKLCPGGRYSKEYFAKSYSVCKSCSVGTFSNAGSYDCTDCPIGRYNTQTASGSCTLCEPGRASDRIRRSTPCDECQAGFFSNQEESITCERCSKGRFESQTGSTACDDCPLGTFNRFEGVARADWSYYAPLMHTGYWECPKTSVHQYDIPSTISQFNQTSGEVVQVDNVNKEIRVEYIEHQTLYYDVFKDKSLTECSNMVRGQANTETLELAYDRGDLSLTEAECRAYGVSKGYDTTYFTASEAFSEYSPMGCFIWSNTAGKTFIYYQRSTDGYCKITGWSDACVRRVDRVMQVFVHDNRDCWLLKNDSSSFDISSFYYYRDIYTSPCGDDGRWVEDDAHQTYVYDRHCVDCPIGLYQDQSGQGSCKECLGGYYQDKTRQTECKVCPPGTFEKGDECISIQGMQTYIFDMDGPPPSNIHDLVGYHDSYLYRSQNIVDAIIETIELRESIKDFKTCHDLAPTDVFMFENGKCYF